MNPSAITSDTDTQALTNRAKATLRGEDPVIQLLDNRMRDIFRAQVIKDPRLGQQLPATLRSGRVTSSKGKSDLNFDEMFKKQAKDEFVKKGFSFYSNDLAEASLLAYKTNKLILNVYGRNVLDKIFVSIL